MKFLAAVLLLAAVASAQSVSQFRAWARQNGKVYTAAQEAHRFLVWKENLAIAERMNLEGHGAKFGATKFADLTNAEFAALYTNKMVKNTVASNEVLTGEPNAESIDLKNELPAIKDQGQCGSCWSFSAIANAESQTYRSTGKVVSLSEQALVSCDTTFNMGCNGGNVVFADLYLIVNGAASEAAYPYASASGVAPKCKSFTPVAYFSNVKSWTSATDSAMMKAVEEYGVLSVAIEADKPVFQLYTSGVLDTTQCGTTIDHGVAVAGFGTDSETGKKYWTVRNSWGSSWGEAGYIRMARGKNLCAINSQPSSIIA